MEGHGALRGVQHEELRPDQPQQCHLVRHLKLGEEGDVLGPAHGREEEPRRQLADVVDAHDVVGVHALAVGRGGEGLGAKEEGDVRGQVGVAVEGVAIGHELAGHPHALGRRHSPPLHRCNKTNTTR